MNLKDKKYYVDKIKESLGLFASGALFALFVVLGLAYCLMG